MNCLRAETLSHWLRIGLLYLTAFPLSERKPLRQIRAMQKKGKTDVWYFEQDGRFAGFTATINGDGLVLLDYIAVSKPLRGQGLGTKILAFLRRQYAGNGIFLEIERVPGPEKGQEERMRRKQFYLSNGMDELPVAIRFYGVEMELMGWDCRMDYARYRAFYQRNYSEAVKNIEEI